MLGMPDRVELDRKIIPALIDSGAKTVLSIGVAYYNAHHPAVFAARALRFARNDPAPLPGFEQDDYVSNSSFDSYPIGELASEPPGTGMGYPPPG